MGPLDQARIRSLASLLIGPINPSRQVSGSQRQVVVSAYGGSDLNFWGSLDHHSLRLQMAVGVSEFALGLSGQLTCLPPLHPTRGRHSLWPWPLQLPVAADALQQLRSRP